MSMSIKDEHLANMQLHLAMFEKIQALLDFSYSALTKELRNHRDKCVDDPYPKGLISTTQFTLSRPSTPMADALEYYDEIRKEINVHTMMHPEGWTWVAITEGTDTSPEDLEDTDWTRVTRDPSPKYFMEGWQDIALNHLKDELDTMHNSDFLKNARPERPFGKIGSVKAEALDSVVCHIDLHMVVEPSANHFGEPSNPEVRLPSANRGLSPTGP